MYNSTLEEPEVQQKKLLNSNDCCGLVAVEAPLVLLLLHIQIRFILSPPSPSLNSSHPSIGRCSQAAGTIQRPPPVFKVLPPTPLYAREHLITVPNDKTKGKQYYIKVNRHRQSSRFE